MEEIVPHPGGGLHRACVLVGRVSKVEMAAPRVLIYKELFPSISTFETPPILATCKTAWKSSA
jgi:hypothetical protein